MLFVNVKSFFPYPNKYKRIYIEEIKIKTLELFFTLDNVVVTESHKSKSV